MDTNESDTRDPLYPRWPAAQDYRICEACTGRGRLADDWCRSCAGMGFHMSGKDARLLELAEAVSAAAAELTDLREACSRALAALRNVMPYFARLPPETEQYVRRAVRSLVEVSGAARLKSPVEVARG